jgi:hypothetical protein
MPKTPGFFTGAEMSDLFTDSALRTRLVTESLQVGDANVLFACAVVHFTKKPNMKKAEAIYNVFLGPYKLWNPIGTLNENTKEHLGLLVNLRGLIYRYGRQDAKARSMNVFQRVATSRDRVVPPGLFDDVVEASDIIESLLRWKNELGYTMYLSGKGRRRNWQELATRGKGILSEAGFDVADLGMRNV